MPGMHPRVDPEPYREFVAAVDRIVDEAVEPPSRVAGLLCAGLFVAADGLEASGNPGGFAVAGP